MNITKKQDGKKVTVALSGRLDTMTAPELDGFLKDIFADANELVFDFKDLEYISSAGLRILLSAQKIMNKKGPMKIINVNDMVNEIFDVTGFSGILTIE